MNEAEDFSIGTAKSYADNFSIETAKPCADSSPGALAQMGLSPISFILNIGNSVSHSVRPVYARNYIDGQTLSCPGGDF